MTQYRQDRDTQPALRCHALAARVALGQTDGLADELTATWLTPKSLPDACDPAFAWWKARGGPGAALIERRARLALEAGEAGLARFLAKSLPAERAAPLLQWAALIEQPRARIAGADRAAGAARRAPGAGRRLAALCAIRCRGAAAAFPALVQARRLDARSASPFALPWRSRCRGAVIRARWSSSSAVHADDFDERAHEWHARAALWAGDWREAARAIAAMPEALRSQTRWHYWAARASEQLGDVAQARAELTRRVIPTDNWYAAHAAARLGSKFAPRLEPLALSDEEIAALAAEPAFVRTRELLLCEMDAEAVGRMARRLDELTAGATGAGRGTRLALGLAPPGHRGRRAPEALQRLRPALPAALRCRGARRQPRTGLPEDLIYAIIRQESLYRADAASSAGALGLMQLLPETARTTARRAGLPAPTRAQLTAACGEHPARLGVPRAACVERFDGETALATAGYNAGPNAARRWLPPAPLDLDVWAENIPFNETRAYVQRVALAFAGVRLARRPQAAGRSRLAAFGQPRSQRDSLRQSLTRRHRWRYRQRCRPATRR